MKRILLISIALLLCLVGVKHFQDINTAVNNNPQPLPLKELSAEEFVSAKEKYIRLSNEKNPKSALGELRKDIQTNTPLLRSCHALVHELGQNAYRQYGGFAEAMKYKDEICNSGYLHGVIESHFAESTDILQAMKSTCELYPREKYLSWECYHGVGHGAMFHTSNDLPQSLKLCDSYETAFARNNCANGVFMENFNTDQKLHPSKFLSKSDPFYPCPHQRNEYKSVCYLYAPTYYLSLNKNNYAKALDWCNTANAAYKEICTSGVGSQAMKENIHDPELVEEICMSGKSSQIQPCIRGMVSLYINHYGSLEPAEKLCKNVKISNRKICTETVKASSHLF